MNTPRRKAIAKIADQIEELAHALSTIADDEQEAYENLPEAFQEGERGEAMSENVDNLNEAVSDLESVFENLREIADL